MSCKPEDRVQYPRWRERSRQEWARLKKRALALLDEDWTAREVARELEVSEGTITQWRHRQRAKKAAPGGAP